MSKNIVGELPWSEADTKDLRCVIAREGALAVLGGSGATRREEDVDLVRRAL